MRVADLRVLHLKLPHPLLQKLNLILHFSVFVVRQACFYGAAAPRKEQAGATCSDTADGALSSQQEHFND